MNPSTNMPDVSKPVDEFGVFLSKLRLERGLTAKSLAGQVGKSAGYITGWENNKRAVNKQVLHQVAKALNLTDAERYELFRLADKRIGIDEKRKGHGPWEQIYLNVAQVWAEVPHEIDPKVSSDTLAAFTDVQAWMLAWLGYDTPGCQPYRIEWPEKIYEAKIRCTRAPLAERVHIPEIIAEEFRSLDACFPLSEESVQILADQMASTYRRWLLSDLERCRTLAGAIHNWKLSEVEGHGAVATIVFQETAVDNDFGVKSIGVEAVKTRVRRELRSFLWGSENLRKDDTFWTLPFKFETGDFCVVMGASLARMYLQGEKPARPAMIRQVIRDAWYLANPDAEYPGLMTYVRDMMHMIAPSDSTPGSWSKSDQEEQARIILLDTLDEAASKMDRELRRAAVQTDQGKGTAPAAPAKRSQKRQRPLKRASKPRRKSV